MVEITSLKSGSMAFSSIIEDRSLPSEHPSASRIIIRLALELANKPYDLSASSNANRITIRLADECSENLRCVFSALNYVKLQRRSSEHPSASRITIRLALELAVKSYDLSASSNASRITKRLADGCSEGPRCVFSALDCVKLQRGPSEHPSPSRITIRLALELAGKPYDLLANSNASRLTIRLADGCSKGPRCVFSALNYVKLQRGSSEHTSASRITIRLTLELADKPYGLPASSDANRITKRLADGCSKDLRCIFSALNCVKLQHEPSEHPSASRIIVRLALNLVGNPYDLSVNSNASQLTIRLADGCSKGLRYVFSALDYVKLQRGSFEHLSASCITIRLALELVGKPYDLPTNSNARRITKWLADGCSEGPRCVFSALDCVKLQRGPSEHPSTSRITIRLALELAQKPYDLPTSSNASRLTIRLANGCSEGCQIMLRSASFGSLISRDKGDARVGQQMPRTASSIKTESTEFVFDSVLPIQAPTTQKNDDVQKPPIVQELERKNCHNLPHLFEGGVVDLLPLTSVLSSASEVFEADLLWDHDSLLQEVQCNAVYL
ncbi:hypothetical protein L7F22_004329 [Adiantum nelumboides]|nr:hypothetical protein [Adiantum nelumboides]